MGDLAHQNYRFTVGSYMPGGGASGEDQLTTKGLLISGVDSHRLVQ